MDASTVSTCSKSWDILYEEMKKLPKGSENAPTYLRHLMEMFVSDFELTMDRRLDMKFWKVLKKLIDDMAATSEDRIVAENVHNLSLGFLTDLCLFVHSNYRMPDLGLPSFLTFSPGILEDVKELKSTTKSRVFCAFVMMRMGDLIRYKGHALKAKQFYEISVRINQADGAAWNQLGVVSYQSANWLDSVYCHTRALHSTIPFPSASANLSSIFKKFANRDTSKDMPIGEQCVAVLAKLHFLLKIEGGEELLKMIGTKMAQSKEFIISLMGIYENLEDGADLEKNAIESIEIIWESLFAKLVEELEQNPSDENVHLLALLLRIPEYCDLTEDIVGFVEDTRGNDTFVDSYRFDHFRCLKKNMLEYPLKCQSFGSLEADSYSQDSDENDDDEDEEEVFDCPFKSKCSSIVDTSLNMQQTTASSSVKIYDDDSEEEVLTRGARRGRAISNDEDDSDSDDY